MIGVILVCFYILNLFRQFLIYFVSLFSIYFVYFVYSLPCPFCLFRDIISTLFLVSIFCLLFISCAQFLFYFFIPFRFSFWYFVWFWFRFCMLCCLSGLSTLSLLYTLSTLSLIYPISPDLSLISLFIYISLHSFFPILIQEVHQALAIKPLCY